MVSQPRRGGVKGTRRSGGEHNQLLGVRSVPTPRPGGASSSTTWTFVPPTPKELTPARRGASAGGSQGRNEVTTRKGELSRSSFGFGRVEVEARRERLVVQGERRLDQAGDPSRRIEMADVGLDRADRAKARFGCSPGAKRLGEPGDLDRIAELRGGAVGLDVGDRLRIDAGEGLGQSDDAGMSIDAGRREAHFGRAVVVHAGALDHRVDRVAVIERVRQPPQGHDPERRC